MRTTPLRYGLGMLGLTIPTQAFTAYLLFYYVDTLGLAIGLATIARTIYAIWDSVNDPIFGYLSDRTRTKLGRRRPWLLYTLPFYLATFTLIFWVPGPFREGTTLFWYFLLVTVIFETFATIQWTNYGALFPELFGDLSGRSRASAVKQAMQITGLIIGIALTPLVYQQIGFAWMGVTYGVIAVVLMLISYMSCKEDPTASDGEPLGLIESFRTTLQNRPFWIYALANTMVQFSFGILTAGMPFYAKYTLGLGEAATSALFASIFAVAMPTVALWSRLTRKWGGRRAWVTANGLLALAVLPLAFVNTLPAVLLTGAFVGLGMSGNLVLSEIILSDIIDRDAIETARRREGMYYSVNGFISRASSALNAATFALLGLLFGYVSGIEPGPTPGVAFRFLMSAVPFVAFAISFLIARTFPFAVKEGAPDQPTLAAAAE